MKKIPLFFLMLLVVGPVAGSAEVSSSSRPAPAASPAASAVDPSLISVKAELNKAFITIGDPVEYTVSVRAAPEVQVLSAIPYPPDDIFKIKKIEEFSNEEGGMKITGKKFHLTTFQLGEFILDPVSIEFRPKGGEVQKIQTSRIFLTVKSVAGGEQKTDIKGLKGLISIPLKFLGWILAAAGILLLLLAPFIYRWLKKKAAEPPVPARVLTAEEEALQSLNQLFDSELIRQGKIKEYYLKLSEILRDYLEKRHGVHAIESTTFELLTLLREKEISGLLRNKIKDVLEFSDLAKFAKSRPDPTEIVTYNKRSREIIEESGPSREAPAGGV